MFKYKARILFILLLLLARVELGYTLKIELFKDLKSYINLNLANVENMWIKILTNHKPLVIKVIYHHQVYNANVVEKFSYALQAHISSTADDTYLMLLGTNLKELEYLVIEVNEELKNLDVWFCRNKLSVNYTKTKHMIINKIPHNLIDEPFKIALNGALSERTESVKYFGVFVDEKLNWSVRTYHLSLQLAKLTGIFYRLRNYVSKKTLCVLYYSLVYSTIQCCNIAWGCTAKKYLIKLKMRVNKIIRAITFSNSFTSVRALYKNLNILKLEDIYKLGLAKFMHQINYDKMPKIFVELFTNTTKIHGYTA